MLAPKRILILRTYLPIISFQISILVCIACVFLGFYILSRAEINFWQNVSQSNTSQFEQTHLMVYMSISLIVKNFKIFIRISTFAYVETLIYIVFQCHML